MVRALIHIEITNAIRHNYDKSILTWARKAIDNLVTFDVDNLSEPSIINYAVDLIKQANYLIVIIDINAEGSAGPLIHLMDVLVNQKSKPTILVLNGENAILSKMGAAIGKDRLKKNQSLEEQQELIKKSFLIPAFV